MRKLLALIAVLLGCLMFVGQSMAATSARYSDCCLQGCEGLMQCANLACEVCVLPQVIPASPSIVIPSPAQAEPSLSGKRLRVGPLREPWNPPD
ncbi:hypothetical protein [Roseateles violae]|uniref:Uncharacterized protein n=1 Tax=Roseateles violae TaxID=3058042 RepID=A0ABT8DWV0_9BURK|nr:hypothetical protein [Pelomonas sp. PFR6]MDN3920894.1 hypothetical protein [Pelomonas sp. PFR6]